MLKRNRFLIYLLLIILVMLVNSGPAVQAQTGGGYDLTWNTLEGGGMPISSDGGLSLTGTFGQPDAVTFTGGSFSLIGGFWSVTAPYPVSLPLIMK